MFVIRKKSLVVFAVVFISVLTSVLCFVSLKKSQVIASANKPTIVLDAGHGGIDDGAIGLVLKAKESEINLSICFFLKEYLEESNFNVVLTRTSSAGLYGLATSTLKRKDMERRKKIIQNANPKMVISIHLNKYVDKSRRGGQVFYKKNDNVGINLANKIQNEFNELNNLSKNYSPLVGDYYILNCSNYPSVLCECGFLSNEQDERLLVTEDYQKEVAYTIYKGIISFSIEIES